MFDHQHVVTKNILGYYDYEYISNINYLENLKDNKRIGQFTPFANDLFKNFNQSNKKPTSPGGMVDDFNNYYINELGVRGVLNYDSEILSAGCSVTFGCGVPEEGTWPHILSNNINKPVVNLSFPGRSIESISNNIIKYCVKYKMPKKIFCFFPGLFRTWFVADENFYSSKKQKDYLNSDGLYLKSINPQIWFDKKENEMFMIKRQRDEDHINSLDNEMEVTLSPHQLILNSVNVISVLELFCLSHNIDLYWTTWDYNSDIIMQKLNKIPDFKLKKYVKFVDDEANNESIYYKLDCRSNHSSELKNHICWDMGIDYHILDGKKVPGIKSHPGIHYQTHVAEFFEKYA